MAKKLVRLLRPNRPDYLYLKQVFKHTRQLLEVNVEKSRKRLPELLTDTELIGFYETVWNARNTNHLVMIKLLIYTGIRNAELTNVQIKDVDLTNCTVRIEQGKGRKTVISCFRCHFMANWLNTSKSKNAPARSFCLNQIVWERFRPEESAKLSSNTPTDLVLKNEFIHIYSGIKSFLTRKGIISPKLQLLSGHSEEKSLAIYRDLALADVADEYESAMQMFPIR
jgi:integrase/recombinase XerD